MTTELADKRYLLLEPLGVGGMATVYRAWDRRLETFRAIKVLAPALAKKASTRKRLQNEAKTMAQLPHRNVVTVHEMSTDDKSVFLVMELLPGGTLIERVEEHGPLPPKMAAQVVADVLSALELAHSHGVVHRDVKPHNVLLDVEGVPKLTDFGIARLSESGLTRTGVVMGTLAYMPPEQKMSSKEVDARADVYASGAMLYSLLTGSEPFDIYAAGMNEAVREEFYAGMPAELIAIMVRATQYQPDDRYGSAAEMAEALLEALPNLADDPPDTPPLVSAERAQKAAELAAAGLTVDATASPKDPGHVSLGTGETEGPAVATVLREPSPPSSSTFLMEDPAPAIVPEQPQRRTGAWVAALLLLLVMPLGAGVLLLVTGFLFFTTVDGSPDVVAVAEVEEVVDPEPEPIAEPAPQPPVAEPDPPGNVEVQPEEEPEEAVEEEVVDPEEEVVEEEIEEPTPPTDEVLEEPEVPAPAPVAPPSSSSGWEVRELPSRGRKPVILVTRKALNTVVDRNGKRFRPELVLSCDRKASAYLLPGLVVEQIVFSSEMEIAQTQVVVDLDGSTDSMRLKVDPDQNVIYFPGGSKWVNKFRGSGSLTMQLIPFGTTTPVTATFMLAGLDGALASFEENCKL